MEWLLSSSLIVLGWENNICYVFDQLCDYYKFSFCIVVEVDDMVMMCLLVWDIYYFVVLLLVVVWDEFKFGVFQDYGVLLGVFEEFYVISVWWQFELLLFICLLVQFVEELLISIGNWLF